MRSRRIAVLAAALAAAAALPASAQAGPVEVQTGRFKLELEGVQRTTWTTRHAAQFECDVNIAGSGRETIRFRSKPVVVDVRAIGRNVLILRGRRPATLDVDATITRDGAVSVDGRPDCADGDGGGGPPPASDCGTKRSRGWVEVRYLAPRRALVGLAPVLAAPLGPFATCPASGAAWPTLLTRGDRDRPIGQQLPVRDLFGHGKSIVVGRGGERLDDGETQSATTIRWSLAFTRVDGGTRG
jgi:hypothetical protein